MSIGCKKAQKRVSLALDHRLGTAGKDLLDRHLATCPQCREWSREQSWLLAQVETLPGLEPSPGFHAALLARIENSSPRPLSWGQILFTRPLAMRAAVFLVFVSSTLLGVFLGVRLDRPASEATAQAFSQALHLDAFADAPTGSFTAAYERLLRGEFE